LSLLQDLLSLSPLSQVAQKENMFEPQLKQEATMIDKLSIDPIPGFFTGPKID
jgi:hypothetical protein